MKCHAAQRSAAVLLVTALALVSDLESTRILAQQPPSTAEPLHQPLDQILDLTFATATCTIARCDSSAHGSTAMSQR